MNKRFQWLITTALILLTGNTAFLNFRTEKRVKTDRETSSLIKLMANRDQHNDQFLWNLIKENATDIEEVDSLAFERLVRAKLTLREAIAKEIDKFENIVPTLVARMNPSVVMIEIPRRTYNRYTGEEEIFWGGGTGVIYDNGVVLTVAHITECLENPDSSLPDPRVRTYDGRTWNILDVATSKDFISHEFYNSPDVGMIRISKKADYPKIKLGNTNSLEYGETIVVIGHPMMEPWSVSTGVLSRKGFEDDGSQFLIQIDARINGGNSGGPVFDLDGYCQGLCSFGKVGQQDEGLNYFVPSDILEEQIPELLEELNFRTE